MKTILFVFTLLIFLSPEIILAKKTTPETALNDYLKNKDKTFEWKVINSQKNDKLTIYQVVFTSQKWRENTWRHELFVLVPGDIKFQDALLFITGGSVKDEQPNLHKMDDSMVKAMADIALQNNAITSIIWQVPNQPNYGGKTEDELISYTLHNFLNDNDYTWPLLFPMTKSAVRAMDVVQQVAKKELKLKVDKFVVSGASKRGWTTWLTGASDKRVKAIAPMVIDVLNMPVNIEYHKVSWGDYSIQIEDYVKLGIAQKMETPGGSALVKMIDPYSYRKTLTMPKMIFMGTNDEYWPVDAVKNYIKDIPGNNHICYIANAGHDLGDKKQALNTLSSFFGTTITGNPYPVCNYSISENKGIVELNVHTTASKLVDANIWTSTSTDRDFRDEKWGSKSLKQSNVDVVKYVTSLPETGFKAFYIELKYKSPAGNEYTECTRMFLTNSKEIL